MNFIQFWSLNYLSEGKLVTNNTTLIILKIIRKIQEEKSFDKIDLFRFFDKIHNFSIRLYFIHDPLMKLACFLQSFLAKLYFSVKSLTKFTIFFHYLSLYSNFWLIRFFIIIRPEYLAFSGKFGTELPMNLLISCRNNVKFFYLSWRKN